MFDIRYFYFKYKFSMANVGLYIGIMLYFLFFQYRIMYWTDWGRQPKIEHAWMDGQQRQVLVSEDLGWPTGLTIDYINSNRVYWCDSKENVIESIKPDGTDRRTVLSGGEKIISMLIQ